MHSQGMGRINKQIVNKSTLPWQYKGDRKGSKEKASSVNEPRSTETFVNKVKYRKILGLKKAMLFALLRRHLPVKQSAIDKISCGQIGSSTRQ